MPAIHDQQNTPLPFSVCCDMLQVFQHQLQAKLQVTRDDIRQQLSSDGTAELDHRTDAVCHALIAACWMKAEPDGTYTAIEPDGWVINAGWVLSATTPPAGLVDLRFFVPYLDDGLEVEPLLKNEHTSDWPWKCGSVWDIAMYRVAGAEQRTLQLG